MKHVLIILSLALMVLSTGCGLDSKGDGDIKLVTPEEMQTLLELEDVQLIDVRTQEEHEEGYIPESQNIDFNSPTFEEDISKLDKSKPVILYCRTGKRSAECSQKLKEAGFVKIYDLEGGFSKWKHDGLDIDSKS
ncbi:rhodanese-like domain-containing protein [Mangrovimonas sp. YM274]|uniref:rhodanese-like domain-containing protein n=1 Tax=Mangrovimonas sp. YM274 TaxID=3070660 RepID=UPI0027DD3161|nr:rhodanese-like domain-containing protein [Mangrovimonas sp. YM274]WMI68079.1 rhodanese-like domain-containing protein [Mangrovimonas sp. YM274]